MSYTIQTIEDDQCVFLSYLGEMPAGELSAARYEADSVLEMRRWNRLLVDATGLQSDPTPVELYDFARSLSSGVPRHTRVALVVRPGQARHAKIVEKLGRRGRLFLTYFLDPDRARAWVTESGLGKGTSFKKETHHV